MSAYGNCTGLAPRDLVLNNLVVCDNARIGNLALGRVAVPFVAAADFQLISNQSFVVNGNMIQLAIKGILTGDVATMDLPVGSIPARYAPLLSSISANCVPSGIPVPPEFILPVFVDPDGLIHTCTSGAPFPIGSYTIQINLFYMR